MIKLENVTKRFGENLAVDEISLEIPTGQILGLLGPNGAGKTTTMRMICGFLAPDEGSIFVEGVNVQKHPLQAQAMIGYLPENNPLYKEMLVSELLEWGADLKQVPRQSRYSLFDFAVSSCGISDVFYRPVGDLSRGYRQRVGLALAILAKPKILVLDEPTEGLDPNQRQDIRNLIKDLGKERTIILSTHVMQEVQAVCDRIVIINKGRIIAEGTPEDLARYATASRVLTLEVEGEGIKQALKEMNGVEKISFREKSGNRVLVEMSSEKNIDLRPQISRLIAEKNWIVWHLSEKKRDLEEVFSVLTR